MIVDSSVLLSAFFPDEAQPQARALIAEHVAQREILRAPDLLSYEVTNVVWQAERRGRTSQQQAEQILESIQGLKIELFPVRWSESLPLARQFQQSVYDSAYLRLAQARGEKFITGDLRLYNAVKDKLDFVLYITAYPL